MQVVQDIILQHLPQKRRVTSQGWVWFNGVCCHHRGHKPDTRMRGNIKFGSDGTIGHNCFNCGYKWRYTGAHLSDALLAWLSWLGVDASEVQQLKLQLLQVHMESGHTPVLPERVSITTKWHPVQLPEQAQLVSQLQEEACDQEAFLQVCAYLHSRGPEIAAGHDYWWSNSDKHDLQHRVIIPFYQDNLVLGWSARWAGTPPPHKPKYWNSSIPPGYLFNQNQLQLNRKFVLVTEGPFDAIACQGVAVLGSHMSEHQIHTLCAHDQTPIILPDRQARNQDLIDQALAFGWYVSFPEWDAHIKDAADACKSYGQIYTITSALAARTNNPIEIGIKRKLFQG